MSRPNLRRSLPIVALLAACYSPPRGEGATDADSTSTAGDTTDPTSLESSETSDASTSTSAGTTSPDLSSDTGSDSSSESSTDGGSSSAGEPVDCLGTPADEIAFLAPVPLPGANTANSEEDGWLSPDELTLWVTSARPDGVGGYDIWHATRDDVDAAFGDAQVVSSVSSASNDERVTLTDDALTMLFASNRPGGSGSFDIMVATRESMLVDFGPALPLANVSSNVSDSAPWISGDGTELYFSTDRTGVQDIYRATIGVGGGFDAPVPVAGINDPDAADGSAVPTADGLAIYFASDRNDGGIHVATRSTRDDGFGEPQIVEGLGSDASEWPVWSSADGCRLVIGSSRPGEGGYDLWVAEREL